MGTLGQDLKEAREKKGLTLKEISERTRISLSFLKGIEEDDYSHIPGDVFVTGFLRTYAKELGLSEKEVLARYRETRQPAQEAQQAAQPEKPARPQHRPKPSIISFGRGVQEKGLPLWAIIVGGLALGGILAGITLLVTSRGKAPEVAVAPPVPSPKPMAPATTAFGHATTFKQATAFKPATAPARPKAPEKPSPAPAQAPPVTGPLTLKLTATENAWYSVRKDGGQRNSAILNKGESVIVRAKDRIVLDIGNAGGVKVEFNGKGLKPYGKPKEVVKNIIFTHDIAGRVAPAEPQKKAVMPARTTSKKKP